MPQKTGLELASDLNLAESRARVIILTTFARPGYLRRALDAGARGYLLKERPASELADAIRRVHSGLRAVDPRTRCRSLDRGPPILSPTASVRSCSVLATVAPPQKSPPSFACRRGPSGTTSPRPSQNSAQPTVRTPPGSPARAAGSNPPAGNSPLLPSTPRPSTSSPSPPSPATLIFPPLPPHSIHHSEYWKDNSGQRPSGQLAVPKSNRAPMLSAAESPGRSPISIKLHLAPNLSPIASQMPTRPCCTTVTGPVFQAFSANRGNSAAKSGIAFLSTAKADNPSAMLIAKSHGVDFKAAADSV